MKALLHIPTTLILAALAALAVGIGPARAQDLNRAVAFNILPQPLDSALVQFSEQSRVQLVVTADIVRGKSTQGVRGQLEPTAALSVLLAGSGLGYSVVNDRSFAIVASPLSSAATATGEPGSYTQLAQAGAGSSQSSSSPEASAVTPAPSSEQRVELEEILVTGSHIRGAEPTSLVVTMTQQEMRLAGHTNLGEVIRALPQNFGGGQNPGVAFPANQGASSNNQNLTGSSSLNLRGLGADATLTLLNGTRLAYDGSSQATDVSVIPMAAIERMEILLDGASAIYGSDAVGGVANIILKRDYEGAELSARFGAATDGGYGQRQYTGVGGTSWSSGGILITGDYSDADPVKANHRDYLSQLSNQNVDIYPQSTQTGALLSGHQEVGASVTLNVDSFYTQRSYEQLTQTSTSQFFTRSADSSIWGVTPALDIALPGDWSARLHAAAGRNESEFIQTIFSSTSGARTSDSVIEFFNGTRAAGIETEGPLFVSPGGHARASIGGGYRENTYDRRTINLITGAITGVIAAEEGSRYAYGEVGLPLVGDDQNIPLMEKLSLSAAVRHEAYDRSGASTTPKVGVIWGIVPGLDLRASWGRSFKAPTLQQQHQSATSQLVPAAGRGAVGAPADSQAIEIFGGNPDLDPEKAETLTVGFVARPEWLPGFTLEFSYFDVDYTDRVGSPIDVSSQALSNPVFAEFVTVNPTVAQQNAALAATGGTLSFNSANAPYDPAKVIGIIDNRSTNVSNQRIKGVDLSAHHRTKLFDGDFSLSGNGSWITEGTRQLRDNAPELPAAGVNFWQAKFRGRLSAGWSRDGFTLSAGVNHIAGIIDRSVTPNVKRSSMTTVDLVADYQWSSDLIGDVAFNLAVLNALDEPPPFLQPPILPNFTVNYDSTNYSALGRVVNATITKRF